MGREKVAQSSQVNIKFKFSNSTSHSYLVLYRMWGNRMITGNKTKWKHGG